MDGLGRIRPGVIPESRSAEFRFGIFGRAVAVSLTAGVAMSLAGCGKEGHTGPGYASKDNVVEDDAGDGPIAKDES
jgi:hypothetical protein